MANPAEATLTRPITETKPKDAATATVAIATEKTIVVTQQETVQTLIPSTPTPIPEGGYITRTTFVDAQTLNPVLADELGSMAFCELMFEGLLRADPFTGELEPNFAKEWTVSDDGLTYTFTVQQGLQWSDGHPITAYDFYFTYSALLSGKLDTLYAQQVSGIEQIEIVDEYTVAVTFARTDCTNLGSLQVRWLPMHVFTQDVDSYDFDELVLHEFSNNPTVFSGPFVLKEWIRGVRWVQVRNDRYWRGVPHLEGIITEIVPGQEVMIEMLQDDEIDIAVDFRPQYLSELESLPDLQIFKFLSDEYDFIGFQLGDPDDPQPRVDENGMLNKKHGAHPILQDSQVRSAIAYAIDRDEIIAKARFGQGIPLYANVLPTTSWAYNVDLEPRVHSVEKAGQLLDKAGWAVNEETGFREKNGRPLRLDLYTNAGNEIRIIMAELIQEQLGQIGIDIHLIAVDWYTLVDILFDQTFDMILISRSDLGIDPDDMVFWGAAYDVPGQGNNFVSYYDPDLEKMLTKARFTPDCDQDERTRLYRQIQTQLYQDLPYYWLDVPRKLIAIDDDLGGVNPGAWSTWHNVHEWYRKDSPSPTSAP